MSSLFGILTDSSVRYDVFEMVIANNMNYEETNIFGADRNL